MDSQFLEAIFTNGIQYPNFFNGRILTATDLQDEQAAFLKLSRYLGQAIGSGVVYGLQVSAADGKSLTITKGLAINLRGDALALPADQRVPLTLPERPEPGSGSPFVPCDLQGITGNNGVVDTNYYLLALTSTARLSLDQHAPHSGLGGGTSDCTSRYEEVGVQFKLVPLSPKADLGRITDLDVSIDLVSDKARSQLAHLCFGTDQLLSEAASPLAMSDRYGLEDALRFEAIPGQAKLQPCDVPLAVFFYRSEVLQFVDMWAVRRPCLPGLRPLAYPTAAGVAGSRPEETLLHFVSPRREAEAAAMLMQFQSQLEDLRSASNADAIMAADHFEYLPAAGFLPLAAPGIDGFDPEQFFNAELDAASVQWFDSSALIRRLIHESFYYDPIRPGDPVDLFRFDDAGDPYLLFMRQIPVAAIREEERPASSPSSSTRAGILSVSVVNVKGEVVDPSLIASVQAKNSITGITHSAEQPTSTTVSSFADQQMKKLRRQAQSKVRRRYDPLVKGADAYAELAKREKVDGFAIVPNSNIFYQLKLPAGTYIVTARLASPGSLYSIETQAKVTAGRPNTATVVIRERELSVSSQETVRIPSKNVLPDGVILDEIIFDPRWKDLYGGWLADLPGLDPGNIDPIPEHWSQLDNIGVQLGVEAVLGSTLTEPTVVAEGAQIYVSRDYRPDVVATEIQGFVQTQDGSRFPVVLVAADNALDKPASAARAPIPEFDPATVAHLDAASLGELDAIASAPVDLVAAVLDQSPRYSESLIAEVRQTLEEDFQKGYLGTPGIDKATSDGLKNLGDKTFVANLEPNDARLIAVLGDRYSERYRERLVQDLAGKLPSEASTLEGTSIPADRRVDLADELNIRTNLQFREAVADPNLRNEVLRVLQVSNTTLEGYVEEAIVGFALGQDAATPDKSIAALSAAATPDITTELAKAGIYTAKDLANQDATELSARTGFSTAELSPLIETATDFTGVAYITLAEGVTRGAVSASDLQEAGLNSTGKLARLEETGTAAINAANATKIKAATGRFFELRDRISGGTTGRGVRQFNAGNRNLGGTGGLR